MIRRLLVAAVVSMCVVCFGTATATSPGGSHGPARAASSPKGSASSKPVHVKGYTKKDGTRVEAHDRKAPEPKTSTPHAEPVHATPAPIRLVTDPVTGQRTFTNEPPALLPARRLPTTVATVSAPARTRGRTSAAVLNPRVAPTGSIAPSGAAVRDAQGRIQQSAAARHAFARHTGFPNGRPGYVIDHIKPLARGADAPSNMQWQTIAEGKAKDRVERVGCR